MEFASINDLMLIRVNLYLGLPWKKGRVEKLVVILAPFVIKTDYCVFEVLVIKFLLGIY
jgi:hypothetical protein